MHQNTLFVLFFVFGCLGCACCAQWSDSFPDGSIVDACAGDVKATFPWAVTLDTEEEIVDINWFYHGRSEEMVAIFSHGHFLSMPAFSHRAEQLDTAGLVLSQINEGDAGNYTVEIVVRNPISGATTTLTKSAILVVYSHARAVTDATVEVTQEPMVVYNNATQQFHIQLTCTGHGRQPPAVIWTLPSGATKVVSTAENGHFHLLVPNPVSGGNYTCRVHDDSPAATCLPSSSPALRGDAVYVDKLEVRLLLLEAKQHELQTTNDDLQAENSQHASFIYALQADNSQLKNSVSQLQADNSQLNNSVSHLQTENRQQASFIRSLQTESSQQASYIHALQADNTQIQADTSQLKTNVSQLQTENSQQASFIQALQTDSGRLNNNIGQLQTENRQLQADNTQLKSNINQLRTENTQQASSIRALQTENSHQASTIQALQTEITQLKSRLDQSQNGIV